MARVIRVEKSSPGKWTEAMQEFLCLKQAEGRSETTVGDYKYHITQFFTRYPKAYNQKTLKKHVLEYMSQPVKPATYNLRLIYLKTFFNWCIKEGIFQENPLEGLKKRRDEGRVVNLCF